MTTESDHDLPHASAHEPARRSGSIVLVLLVAGAIVAAAVAFMTLGRAQAQPYILGLLALLAMVGLFNLFAFAAGIIRFADRIADDPIMRPIADHAFDGLAVTDSRGHVVYSNAAYLALTGAATPQDARPVERVFIGNPDVSEAVFRLLKAAREGKRQQEEVRVAGTDGAHGRWLRMRVRPLGQSKREAKFAVWSIADITRDRERQEDVFQELQHAIEYLDHAPCGFFSVNAVGRPRLCQCHAGQLARSRSRRDRQWRTEADRHRVGRRRLAADLDRAGARRGQDRGVRHRSAHARRQDHAGAALSQAGIRRRRRARRLAHPGDQPRPRRAARSAARRRSPLHALLRSHPDGDRDRRQVRRGGARQCAVCQAGAEPQFPARPASRSCPWSTTASAAS